MFELTELQCTSWLMKVGEQEFTHWGSLWLQEAWVEYEGVVKIGGEDMYSRGVFAWLVLASLEYCRILLSND